MTLELLKLAANRPTTDSERAALLRHHAVLALELANCPDQSEERIAVVISHLVLEDVEMQHPDCPLDSRDNARRKLTITYARVAGKDGKPRMVGSWVTGLRHVTIAELIAELRNPYPLENHKSTAALNVASRLAW